MKYVIMTGVVAAAVLLAGCGKKSSSSESSAELSSLPALQPALTAFRSGDKSTAIADFLAVDWSVHPLVQAGSPLSHSDDQMKALRAHSEADYHAESKALSSQLLNLIRLTGAVRDAGNDAVSKGDIAQARKDFTSLKQCGAALDKPDYTRAVQSVGRNCVKEADAGLAKIRQ